MTLFPSDLRGSPERAEVIELAGRVLDHGERRVVVADAFAAVDAELLTALPLEIGDLVVLSGSWSGTAFVVDRVVQRQSAPLPRGDGDVARFIFQGIGGRLALRARALGAVRAYFERERFIEVETPLAVPAPGVDRNVEAVSASPGWFITSPELEMKRLIVGGVPRQYQLARVRRREESGALHEEEFTLLEWYRAFAGQEAVMRDTEALVSEAARAVRGRAELVAPDGRLIDAEPPFERVSVDEAFRRHAAIADVSELAASDTDRYFELLIERVEPALAAHDRPVFLLDYPISEAALARPCPHDARYAERFELYAGGVELCNGYGELTDPVEQRRRCEEEAALRQRLGRTVYPINERFLAALEAGMPPSGGNALGVDRLVMLACGARTIQEVLAFPQSQR